MQKKHLLIPLIALTVLIPKALAVSSTPSASITPSPASEAEVTENLKKKILENLDSSKDDLTPTTKARGYVGVVKDVIKDTLIMEDKDGKKDIKLSDNTNILRTPGNAVIKAENIRLGDYIIAIGFPGETDTLSGRRLIVSTDPIKPPEKSTGIGTIAKIGKTSLTLKLAESDQVMTITSKTIYKSSVGTIELADLSLGDTLIYTATLDNKDVATATVIMRTSTAAVGE